MLVDERDDPLGADGTQPRHRRVPALAPAADQPQQLREGRDTGVGQARDQVRRKPALERVVWARRLDQGGFHTRERGVLALAQAPVARHLAIDRRRARRRIRLEIEREQVTLAVDVVGVDRIAESVERGWYRRLALGTAGTLGAAGVRLGRQAVRLQSQQVDSVPIARAARGDGERVAQGGQRAARHAYVRPRRPVVGMQCALLEAFQVGPIQREVGRGEAQRGRPACWLVTGRVDLARLAGTAGIDEFAGLADAEAHTPPPWPVRRLSSRCWG